MQNKKPEHRLMAEWLFCPACGSHNFMHRAKGDDYRCRKCGAIFQAYVAEKRTRLKSNHVYSKH